MKRIDVINLIKYHYQSKDDDFYRLAFKIAKEFEEENDKYAAGLIESIINSNYSFSTQYYSKDNNMVGLEKLDTTMNSHLFLPDAINDDVDGIISAIINKKGLNKFLFSGKPGTGKTESAKYVANSVDRKLYLVSFTNLIDSRLGETLKNIERLFATISSCYNLDESVFLFDELDVIALDRINNNDVREMGRASSLFIKCLDRLNEKAIIVATTNLSHKLDKAIKRRFDYIIDFDRYSKKDLADISLEIAKELKGGYLGLSEQKIIFSIFYNSNELYSPSDIRNIIKISLAFSNPSNKYEYLIRIFDKVYPYPSYEKTDLVFLIETLGLTYREASIISGIPISTISRNMSKKEI